MFQLLAPRTHEKIHELRGLYTRYFAHAHVCSYIITKLHENVMPVVPLIERNLSTDFTAEGLISLLSVEIRSQSC